MNNKYKNFFQEGFTLMEIMVSIALVAGALVALSSFNIYSLYAANQTQKTALADHLAVEAMEAIRSFRNNNDWSTAGIGSLTVGADYYPSLIVGAGFVDWDMVSGIENIDGYTRRVVFEPVSRDILDEHIESVYDILNDDPDTRKVTVYVGWDGKTRTIVSYITSWIQ